MNILGKINTKGVLIMKGIFEAKDTNYLLYLVFEESIDHLLIHCHNHGCIWARFID